MPVIKSSESYYYISVSQEHTNFLIDYTLFIKDTLKPIKFGTSFVSKDHKKKKKVNVVICG